MKYSFDIWSFLKRSLVFPFLLFSSISLQSSLKKAFLSLLANLWNSALGWVYFFLSPLLYTPLLSSAICKASSHNHFAFVEGVCNFLGSVPPQQKIEEMDQHYSSWMDQCCSSVLQLCFIYKIKENTSSRHDGCQPKRCEEQRERPPALWLLFLCFIFYSLPPGPALCKLGEPGVLFVLPEVLTPVLGPSFDLFLQAFPSLSFSHHHSGLLFPNSNSQTPSCPEYF